MQLKRTFSLSTFSILAYCLVALLSASSTLGQGDAPSPRYLADPNTLQVGTANDVFIRNGSTFDPLSVQVSTSAGSGTRLILPVRTADDNRVLIVHIEVGSDAEARTTYLQIKETGKMMGLAELNLRSTKFNRADPIPHDLPEPTVAWKVLTNKETRAAFGHYVSTRYYCIEATITNRSGYDYQVGNIEFEVPNISANVPATTLGMARSTLDRAHQIGWRNTSLSMIKALGPILTGFTPFFKVQNHQLTFTKSVNIFSDPFEKGFEAIIPDTTIPELQRLNDQILSDGFISKNAGPTITKYVLFTKDFFSKNKVGNQACGDGSPQCIMEKLGKIHLSANPIIMLNARDISSSLGTSNSLR
jgi:hypothetical protein